MIDQNFPEIFLETTVAEVKKEAEAKLTLAKHQLKRLKKLIKVRREFLQNIYVKKKFLFFSWHTTVYYLHLHDFLGLNEETFYILCSNRRKLENIIERLHILISTCNTPVGLPDSPLFITHLCAKCLANDTTSFVDPYLNKVLEYSHEKYKVYVFEDSCAKRLIKEKDYIKNM